MTSTRTWWLAVAVIDGNALDVTQFATLLDMIPKRFSISEVYPDKGSYSFENYRLGEED